METSGGVKKIHFAPVGAWSWLNGSLDAKKKREGREEGAQSFGAYCALHVPKASGYRCGTAVRL